MHNLFMDLLCNTVLHLIVYASLYILAGLPVKFTINHHHAQHNMMMAMQTPPAPRKERTSEVSPHRGLSRLS